MPHYLAGGRPTARYHLTLSRFLGVQKFYEGGEEHIRFAIWAPNAQKVEVVFGKKDNGYIRDDGTGIDPNRPVIPLAKIGGGIWASEPLPHFQSYTGLPYMYRILNAHGATRMRTDIHSRWQIGRGDKNPQRTQWDGNPASLDGGVSCSVVIDQDVVREEFEPSTNPPKQIMDEEFWSSEFTPGKPVPSRLTELVIYELHIGSLGYGRNGPGNLQDAMNFIPHLVSLGVNAVELMPVSETGGILSWGYGDRTISSSSPAPVAATSTSTSCANATATESPSSRTSSTTTSIMMLSGRSGSTTQNCLSKTSTTGTRAGPRTTQIPATGT